MTNIRAIHFYQYILGLFNDIILQRYDILISLVKNFVAEKLLQLLWAGENPLKTYNLMHYFDVILLRDVI